MILKPSACIGCPFADKGEYFTPDVIIPNSTVLFIAQNPGENEEAGCKLIKRHWHGSQYVDEFDTVQPQPLIGATGQLFDNRFLPLAQLKRSEVSVANVIRCRPGVSLGLKPNQLPPITSTMKLESSKADIAKAIKHCNDAYLHIPESIKLIVTMGRYAMFGLTGIQSKESEYTKRTGTVESWRGYALDYDTGHHKLYHTVDTSYYHNLRNSERRLFVTMHIAALFEGENKKYYHAVLEDFNRLGRLLKGTWPSVLPQWSDIAPTSWPNYAAFDTEYVPATNELIRWSLCDTAYNLYCVEAEDTNTMSIEPNSTVIMQNALADISHLSRIVDMSEVNIEDLMLAHSVLWTGEPHSLNYIASIAGAFNRYKHLAHEEGQQQLYSALDAYEPMYIWQHNIIPEFKRDAASFAELKRRLSPQMLTSWQIYKKYRLPLIQIINKAQRTGVKIDGPKLREVQRVLQERVEQIKEEAKAITGDFKFNIGGSKQMRQVIYG